LEACFSHSFSDKGRLNVTSPVPPLVSIVTPVYNGEEYLAQCIESVLKQTYSNWEYLIVNNCSTDSTPEIVEAYARQDCRIHVYHNDTFLDPAEVNFNHALRLLSPDSRYCKMVLADDWIYPECIERMVELAEASPSVGIVGAYGLRGDEFVWRGLPVSCSVVPGREIGRDHLLGKLYVFGNPTSTLLRSDLVRASDPFYNELNTHSDTEKCYELLQSCDMGFVHQVLSYSRPRKNSLRSYSQRMNTLGPARIADIISFGAFYLEDREWKIILVRKTLG
jgi:glycosyltransferase involved in cell wall biosynthesis